MTRRVSCPHEGDVLDLVAVGQWPVRADEALRGHVEQCEICRDLAATAMAFADLDHEPAGDVHMPDASIVWYRAAVDARREANRRATAPFVLVEAAAAVGASGLLWAFRGQFEPWAAAVWRSLVAGLVAATPALDQSAWMADALRGLWWVGLVVGCSAGIAVLAIYLARLADRGGDAEPGRPTTGGRLS